ncbi:hypothetical protein [Sphingomonas asaccharolytica]|uniref:hypothetical protein n=1 Tax=Sphingomonas asaccharolytica TaxID=40681 RepID=UPI00083411DF|nr:hypothetical protein [Sphingomonas asaccharolytica]
MSDDLFSYSAASGPAAEAAGIGIKQAVDHADRVDPGWSDRAFEMLEGYALTHFEFMTEEVRVWATEAGLPPPPDGRAWGAVTLRAAKAKLIVVSRYQNTRVPPAHAAPRAVWRSQIYQEAA